ncbi:tRNA lysidine(34) synthetase TilS [Roseateles saccharophilus]|uniref:tRNA(Ile)-lysidine synthase n=1 Tax=Roseateles saccharophilus TaxID=304 RepID=A0A4R3VHZ5_ROSSA|nr:tRNA lysidine(34) synthetase TilS [Roseateles saccharophilus]MDG0832520.1 tRNA lysidine(34) synthetase TilS [Roseateles saccharophilus]TCV03981.1 tRNA(Ile)-lysidine synthase [Roseateles saccharophilus]
MADSATPRTGDCVAVAFSGGLDSTALLHATVRAAAGGQRVIALHVHHGLQSQADDWALHCERVARELGAGFACARLDGVPARGDSVEAWAREGRHLALRDMAVAAGADLLLLAHHRRDQAETFLLQALRGAGVAGLAGMPRMQWRDGVCWARPWLDRPRDLIRAYAEHQGLGWIEDPSNADARYARNRLRQTLWPAFPAAESGLAQAARWAQQAVALATEVAAEDLARLVTRERLDLAALGRLSPARASNALRAWLSGHTAAPASLVERLLSEWRRGATLSWPAPGGALHAYRDGLFWEAAGGGSPAPSVLDLSRPGRYDQPGWRGAWIVEAASPGIAVRRLQRLTQRARAGGEQFQRAPAAVPRSLKKACQEAGLPPWRRGGPLLFDDEAGLLAVAGLGMDARAFAEKDEPQLALRWQEDSALLQSEGEGGVAA